MYMCGCINSRLCACMHAGVCVRERDLFRPDIYAYQSTGLPMKTALAPRASALMTSVPLVMPPSTYTSTRPATARQMSGSTCS